MISALSMYESARSLICVIQYTHADGQLLSNRFFIDSLFFGRLSVFTVSGGDDGLGVRLCPCGLFV